MAGKLTDLIASFFKNTPLGTDIIEITSDPSGTPVTMVTDLSKLPVSTATQTALDLKLNISSVVNSLTSTSTTNPLSAAQGKVLKDLVDSINSLLTSDETTLDTLQEIVDFIQLNRSDLDALTTASVPDTLDKRYVTDSDLTNLSNLSGTNTGDQTITLTSEATGSGTGSFAVTLLNSAVIGKVLTGFTSGAGTVAATDTILQAFQKIVGNIAALVTGVSSVNSQTGTVILDADDIDDSSTTNKFTSASDISKLAGIEAGADVTDSVNIGTSIDGATVKTTPVDGDYLPILDSAASNVLKKLSWANLKATLKTYFDTLYQATGLAALKANNLSDLASAATARSNLGLASRSISFGAITPDNDTIYLTSYAPVAGTINSVKQIATGSGTITATVKINGTDVTGLASISVTSSAQDVNATAANTFSVGDKITLVLSSNSSASDFRGALIITI